MKTITTITCFLAVFLFANTQNKTIEATYDGYEEGIYYFTDTKDESLEFQDVEKSVLETYDLMSKKFENKVFQVTYKEVVEDDGDEEYTSYVITALKLKEEK
ncbi:hypothetical protein [Kordia jejudonensis]|uniref:hypothetical protein n=1 Tax=Kordia jejudonensis TaxID=1348245 RepID=UPI0006299D49|nr:hypothetical protein [Kordia jejudonensis]